MVKEIEFDSEALIRALNEGKKIDAEELETVVALLELVQKKRPQKELEQKLKMYRSPGLDEIYSLLTIVGKADIREQAEVVDSFLNYQDPLTVALALEILCIKWGLTESYLERVIGFALGVVWDVEHDLKHLGLVLLGKYIKDSGGLESSKTELLELLHSSFSSDESDSWTKLKAYQAILLASGAEEVSLPSDFANLDYSPASADIDWQIIEKLEKRLA